MLQAGIILIILLALYLLYELGLIALQRKRAMLFTSSINGSRAKFSSCTGTITRIIRIKESGNHEISFRKSSEKGSICISLFDHNGNTLISNGEDETYCVCLSAGKRYKLCVQMEKATGNYEIEIA